MSQLRSTAIVIAAGVSFGVLLGPAPAASADIQPHPAMLRYPDVSRTQIVFVYANDLWLVSRDGGQATPLASPPGPEGFPKFSSDGKTIAFITRWDGATWSPFDSGVSGTQFESVRSLTVFNNELIVGGFFDTAGEKPARHIARWDGVEWSSLGVGMNGAPSGLAEYNGELIAGGYFDIAGGTTVNNIIRWDGKSWSPLGSGVEGQYPSVRALTVYNSELIAGGFFVTADGSGLSNIARWDTTSWSPLGSGMNSELRALTEYNGELIAGGDFTAVGSTSANRIARWDGTSWAPLGQGVGGYEPTVWALTVFDDKSDDGPALFAGGEFTTAGGMSSQRIAKWVGCAGVVVGDLDGDGTVGITDLLILLGSWGPCADCDVCPADLDGDCTVGILDLLTLLANWDAG